MAVILFSISSFLHSSIFFEDPANTYDLGELITASSKLEYFFK